MAVIILAGGLGRRMGSPKAITPFLNEHLLARVQRNWSHIMPTQEIITVGPRMYNCMVEDFQVDLGPLGGIIAGLHNSRDELNYIVGCDFPFVESTLVTLLDLHLQEFEICVAELSNHIQPFPGLYRRCTISALETFLSHGGSSVIGFLQRVNCKVVSEQLTRGSSPQLLSFINLNTPEELSEAEHIASAMNDANKAYSSTKL